MRIIAILAFIFTTHQNAVLCFRDQIVGVRGKLSCNERILQGATVRLIDKNYIGPDVILAENKTNYQGNYEVIGRGKAIIEMNVYIQLIHDCDDHIIPCQRVVSLRVPSAYITRTSYVSKYFEAGTMNMAFRYPDEKRTCVSITGMVKL